MARNEVFIDSNIVLYAFDAGNPHKATQSKALLATGGTISVQVLNEVANVLRRKWHFSWAEAHEVLTAARAKCEVVPLTTETHDIGLKCAERFQLSTYDAMIVAAAVIAGCTTLYSEDMHDGLVIDGVTVKNPYQA